MFITVYLPRFSWWKPNDLKVWPVKTKHTKSSKRFIGARMGQTKKHEQYCLPASVVCAAHCRSSVLGAISLLHSLKVHGGLSPIFKAMAAGYTEKDTKWQALFTTSSWQRWRQAMLHKQSNGALKAYALYLVGCFCTAIALHKTTFIIAKCSICALKFP